MGGERGNERELKALTHCVFVVIAPTVADRKPNKSDPLNRPGSEGSVRSALEKRHPSRHDCYKRVSDNVPSPSASNFLQKTSDAVLA